jgi:exopolysaccharide production protein ExoZ
MAVSAHRELISIQYLRGVAAMLVLITHTLQWPLGYDDWFLLKTGRLGVEIFFVISGFIITVISGANAFKPGRFIAKRAMRIIPAYWVATLLVTILALMLPQQFRTTIPTVEGFLKSLFFFPSQDPKAPLLNLGWTLDYEAFFYFIFACSFFLKSELRTLAHIVLLGALVAVGQMNDGLGYVASFYTSPSLIGFVTGTILAQAYRHGIVGKIQGTWLWALVAALPILLVAYYSLQWESLVKAPLHVHLVLSMASLCIVMLGLNLDLKSALPHWRPLKFIGDASYSIYLFHLFPLGIYWAVSKRLFDVTQPLAYIPLVLLGIAVNLAFGLICHIVVERPFLNLYKVDRVARGLPSTETRAIP